MLQDDRTIEPLTYGRIASYYYLKHQTIRMFKERLKAELSIHELLSILTVSFTLRTYSCCCSVTTYCVHLPDLPKSCMCTVLSGLKVFDTVLYIQG